MYVCLISFNSNAFICVIPGVPRPGGLMSFLLLGGSKIGHLKAEGLCGIVVRAPYHNLGVSGDTCWDSWVSAFNNPHVLEKGRRAVWLTSGYETRLWH